MGNEVDACYQNFLNRAADDGARASAMTDMLFGGDDLMIAQVVGSMEYFRQANPL